MEIENLNLKLANVKLHNYINNIQKKGNETKKKTLDVINQYSEQVEEYKKMIIEKEVKIEKLEKENKEILEKYNNIPQIIRRVFDKKGGI